MIWTAIVRALSAIPARDSFSKGMFQSCQARSWVHHIRSNAYLERRNYGSWAAHDWRVPKKVQQVHKRHVCNLLSEIEF